MHFYTIKLNTVNNKSGGPSNSPCKNKYAAYEYAVSDINNCTFSTIDILSTAFRY